MLEVIDYPYETIEPMSPRDRYPDVRVTALSGRVAVEVTEIHWGVGPKGGSPIRQQDEAAIRAGKISGHYVDLNPIPGIIRAVEAKCGKHYSVNGDDLWLLLIGGSPAAPSATFVFAPDLAQLNAWTRARLAGSRFSRCYLFCLLAVGGHALYGWDRDSLWQNIIPGPSRPDPPEAAKRRALPWFPVPVPHYIA